MRARKERQLSVRMKQTDILMLKEMADKHSIGLSELVRIVLTGTLQGHDGLQERAGLFKLFSSLGQTIHRHLERPHRTNREFLASNLSEPVLSP
jgi:hypothetical protein